MTQVLRYARYLSEDSDRPYEHVQFCGSCRRNLEGTFRKPRYPEDVDAPDGSWYGAYPDREYEHWTYCPWCGTALDAEWWRNQPVQNERAIDHYRNPGSHKGDTHEFVGSYEGHVVGSTDPEYTCWCEPEITPGVLGCTVRHQDRTRHRYSAAGGV